MKKLVLRTLLAAAAVLAAPFPEARAVYILTLAQSGNDLVATGTGSLNITTLFHAYNNNSGGNLNASQAWLYIGDAGPGPWLRGLSGPANFGFGSTQFFGAGSGPLVGVYGGNYLQVPQNYVSGTDLGTSTATFANASLASAGLTPGSYVYNWGSGANADSFTVNISAVPEPSTWAAVAAGVGLLGVARLRRRTGGRV